MLAARGVSLGIGKDINLSGLNQLSAADKALLGRIDKRKKAAEKQKPKFVIKKHVDSKTLWIACVTIIVGSSVMLFGLLATIAGYFDEEIGRDIFGLPWQAPATYDGTGGDKKEKVIDNNEIRLTFGDKAMWLFLKSLQYLGPIFMGVGMFSLIMACVLTLESRDRHTNIIEQQASVSSRYNKGQNRSGQSLTYKTRKPVDPNANIVQTIPIFENDEEMNQEFQQNDGSNTKLISNGPSISHEKKIGFSDDVLEVNAANVLTTDTSETATENSQKQASSICIETNENCANTDVATEYTIYAPVPANKKGASAEDLDVIETLLRSPNKSQSVSKCYKDSATMSANARRESLPEISNRKKFSTVKKISRSGQAPLVRFDTITDCENSSTTNEHT